MTLEAALRAQIETFDQSAKAYRDEEVRACEAFPKQMNRMAALAFESVVKDLTALLPDPNPLAGGGAPPPADQNREIRNGECRECHCTTGGSTYCYEHVPYTVIPKADGSFLVDRYGSRKRVSYEPPDPPPGDQEPDLLIALQHFVEVAKETAKAWDNDQDSRTGKLLNALAGRLKGYRHDIDRIHDAIRVAAVLPGEGTPR